jgi:hypothetical protein
MSTQFDPENAPTPDYEQMWADVDAHRTLEAFEEGDRVELDGYVRPLTVTNKRRAIISPLNDEETDMIELTVAGEWDGAAEITLREDLNRLDGSVKQVVDEDGKERRITFAAEEADR